MSLSIFALNDKVAIVTGGGRGIGKAIALGLADAGAQVVVSARTVAEIEATAAEIKGRGGRCLAVVTDVRVSDQVANMVEQAVKEFGRIDILVNNAGGSFNLPFQEMSENAWDAIIRENLKSVFLCTKAVGKVMIGQKEGSIINIASVAGQGPVPGSAPYGAAKAAVISITQTLAVEWAPFNIRVNAIAPGWIKTPGLDQIHSDSPQLEEARLKRIPLGRLGQPHDIVGTAIYLASRASSYVTGATFVIDGGLISLVT